MNLDEKKERLIEIAKELKPSHLIFAKSLSAGSTQTKAYIDAGYESDTPRVHACQLLVTNSNVNDYVELSKEIAAEEAQSALNYTEEQWLKDQLMILRMATGELKRKETAVVEGQVKDEIQYAKVDLTAANKAQELLGKRHGLLTDNLNNNINPHESFLAELAKQ